jgi:hypothetical protein
MDLKRGLRAAMAARTKGVDPARARKHLATIRDRVFMVDDIGPVRGAEIKKSPLHAEGTKWVLTAVDLREPIPPARIFDFSVPAVAPVAHHREREFRYTRHV